MIRASVSHAKNNLSALLNQVRAGETIEITDRDRPVARIVPVANTDANQRLQELARLGLVRLPIGGPLTADDFHPIKLEGKATANVVEALLEEREEGY